MGSGAFNFFKRSETAATIASSPIADVATGAGITDVVVEVQRRRFARAIGV
jgi:hypothetical protein